jgi:GNAT acetyltransferase-like protein
MAGDGHRGPDGDRPGPRRGTVPGPAATLGPARGRLDRPGDRPARRGDRPDPDVRARGPAAPAGTFEVGIALRESQRGKGYGGEAVTLLTGWLFEHAGAQAVQAPTDPANVAMRTVFDRVGWTLAGTVSDYGRRWVMYRITRPEWKARSPAG